jgi:hypothetical protein
MNPYALVTDHAMGLGIYVAVLAAVYAALMPLSGVKSYLKNFITITIGFIPPDLDRCVGRHHLGRFSAKCSVTLCSPLLSEFWDVETAEVRMAGYRGSASSVNSSEPETVVRDITWANRLMVPAT